MNITSEFRVGVLTTLDCPILPIHLEALLEKKITQLIVICDTKSTDKKDIEIWNERTGGLLGGFELQKRTMELLSYLSAPVHFVRNHNSPECVKLISRQKLKILINSGTPRRLSTQLLESTEFGALNVHPGILPKYRGSCAPEWSILNGDRVGNTVHFMDEGYDSGPIIDIEFIDWKSFKSYEEMRSEIYRRSGRLIAKTLESISEGKTNSLSAQKQEEHGAYFWKPMTKDLLQEVKMRFPQ